MNNKLLIPLLLSFSFSALAENYAVFMGGGGEPKGDKTMFDREIPNMKKALDPKTWQSEVSFNGGHKNTEAAMTKAFGSAPPFTAEAYKKIITDYKEKIQNGTLKSGDQLLLYINTHGAQRSGWSKEKSHSIATAGGTIQDFNTGAGSTLVSMDDLESLLKLAHDKGVKVGLVDFSCHSGAALALQQPNTCVISASGPNHYAYGGTGGVFSAQFLKNMKKGRSLEDVFLLARKNTSDTSFPMISSPVGNDLNQEIYETLTPYLYDYDPKFNKFTPYLMSEINQGEACEAPQRLESILKLIDEVRDLKNIAKDATYKSQEADKLKAALKDYFALMEQLKNDYNALSLPEMKSKEKFCSPYKLLSSSEQPGCIEYTVEEIVSASFEWSENYYKEQLSTKMDDFSKKFYNSHLQNIEKVKARRNELMAQYPDMKKRETFFKDQPRLESRTGALARRVAMAQQDFYQALYKQRSQNESRPNPCKDFVL